MTRANSDRTRRHDDTERDHCTRELFEQLLTSDCPSQRTEARDQILKLHLDLSDALAGRYARKGIDRDDLVQVARLGLLHAINRYRPDRGSFVGFAIPTITGELKRHFRDHGWTVRPPRRLQELRLRYLAAQDEATQQGSTTPPDGEPHFQSVPEEPAVRNERTASRRAAVCSEKLVADALRDALARPHERSSGNVHGKGYDPTASDSNRSLRSRP